MSCTTWLIRDGSLIIRDGELLLCEDAAVVVATPAPSTVPATVLLASDTPSIRLKNLQPIPGLFNEHKQLDLIALAMLMRFRRY